jgi:hypothetical protein
MHELDFCPFSFINFRCVCPEQWSRSVIWFAEVVFTPNPHWIQVKFTLNAEHYLFVGDALITQFYNYSPLGSKNLSLKILKGGELLVPAFIHGITPAFLTNWIQNLI